MIRSQRLLELLQLLRAYSYPVSALVLVDKLNVTPRTIYRDINTLREQGAEIVGERGIGYELRSDNHLPPLNFTQLVIYLKLLFNLENIMNKISNNHVNKIRVVRLAVALSLSFVGQQVNANADTNTNTKTHTKACYDVQYLDFFGLTTGLNLKWTTLQLDGLLATDFDKRGGDSKIKANFMLPAIVYQLKVFHPNCSANVDIEYLQKLSALYYKIRSKDYLELSNVPIAQQIDTIRDDFNTLTKDTDYLAAMTSTLDDGPFYGVDAAQNEALEPSHRQQTPFGELTITEYDNKTILTGKDRQGKVIWQKWLTGLLDKNLSHTHFTDAPIEVNSLATIVPMYANGERLTLYLKNDGQFMYYFHSW